MASRSQILVPAGLWLALLLLVCVKAGEHFKFHDDAFEAENTPEQARNVQERLARAGRSDPSFSRRSTMTQGARRSTLSEECAEARCLFKALVIRRLAVESRNALDAIIAAEPGSFISQASSQTYITLASAASAEQLRTVLGVLSVTRLSAAGTVAPALAIYLDEQRSQGLPEDQEGSTNLFVSVAATGAQVGALAEAWRVALNQYQGAPPQGIQFNVPEESQAKIVVTSPNSRLGEAVRYIADREEVMWVETRAEYKTMNKYAAMLAQGGTGTLEFPLWAKGLRGQNQIIGVADTGLDVKSAFFRDTTASVNYCYSSIASGATLSGSCGVNNAHRKVLAYRYFKDPSENVNISTNMEDEYAGHGTHVVGSIAGLSVSATESCTAGYVSRGVFTPTVSNINPYHYNGSAPEAKVIFDDIGNFRGSLNIPWFLDVGLFPYSYDRGARFHSNSWGPSIPFGDYSSWSQQADNFLYTHPDALVLFAAGNNGRDGNSGENDVPFGIGDVSTSKNALIVGASESYDASLGDIGLMLSDGSVLSKDHLASFSSRGPTFDDFRFKPDVVCAGRYVVSAMSQGSNPPQSCKVIGMQGTSMATPICAGAAALVRQYFVEGFYVAGVKNTAVGFEPSGALVKAMMMHSGKPLKYQDKNLVWQNEDAMPTPNRRYGYGMVDLSAVLRFASSSFSLHVEKSLTITQSSVIVYALEIPDDVASAPFRVTIAWTDPPASFPNEAALVHDLHLVVIDSYGTAHYGNGLTTETETHATHPVYDVVNNNEQVTVPGEAGFYEVRVYGSSVADLNGQTFALVMTGNFDASTVEEIDTQSTNLDCPANCNSNGGCELGRCYCQPGYYGPECEQHLPILTPGGPSFEATVTNGGWGHYQIAEWDYPPEGYDHFLVSVTVNSGNPWVYSSSGALPTLQYWDGDNRRRFMPLDEEIMFADVTRSGSTPYVSVYAPCCEDVEVTIKVNYATDVSSACIDRLYNGADFFDIWGYTCADYQNDLDGCSMSVSYSNPTSKLSADQMCCACGGGSFQFYGTLGPSAPSPSPTPGPTPGPTPEATPVSDTWPDDPRKTWGKIPEYMECVLPSSWPQLSAQLKVQSDYMTNGGLGRLTEPGLFTTWVCVKGHECATTLGDTSFCFVYDEQALDFIPWGTATELALTCPSAMV